MKNRSILLSLCSALLLVLSFPTYNLSWLAWIAFVPLFFSIEGCRGKDSLRYGFITGFGFFIGLIYWVINTMKDYGGIPLSLSIALLIILSAYLGLYFAIFTWFISSLKGVLERAKWAVAPFIWTALEYIRGHLFSGFPWGLMGYSQYENLTLVQIADITGVYGVSSLILLVNGAIYSLLKYFLGNRESSPYRKRAVLTVTSTAIICVVITTAYGTTTLKKYNAGPAVSVRVALIQGNIDQSLKWSGSYRQSTLDLYEKLTLSAIKKKPDLVIWPETAAPFFFQEPSPYRAQIVNLAKVINTPLLFGSPAYEMLDKERFNSYNRAYLLGPSGNVSGSYNKMHLVPFGEFVPLKNILTFVDKLVEGIGDFSQGTIYKVFDIQKASFSALICYEVIFPGLVRSFIQNGAGFLVHITNDAWFGKSNAPDQHFAIVTLRAIENRVPVARAANTGITGIISATGEIIQRGKVFEPDQITGTLRLVKKGKTLYTEFGDFFACFCCVISSLALFFTTISRKKNERKCKESNRQFTGKDWKNTK